MKSRDLLKYPVETDDLVIVCESKKNHGRLGRVISKWDGFPVLGCAYEYLRGRECFVVQSIGDPYTYEEPIELTSIYYAISQTYHLVVEAKHLKRVACAHQIKWKAWGL